MSDFGWLNTSFEDFDGLLSEKELVEEPVPIDVFMHEKKYLGIKQASDLQKMIIERSSQIFLPHTLTELYGEERARQIWEEETVSEIIAQCGKGSGKDFSARCAFLYTIYKLHCMREPLSYYGKAHGTYIDLLNLAVNAEQAERVFFQPLKNMLTGSPYFSEQGFELRKKEVEFYQRPIRLFSGNSESEAWEGLDLMLVVLDEIAAFKATLNTTPILTPNGWIKTEDIRVGNKVIGQNGKPTEVLGVYPQGQSEVFEVEFEDSSTVQCSDDHYWTVREYSDGRRISIKTLRLRDFKSLELKGKWNQKRYAVPVVEPVEFAPSAELPIDPYVMGILLSEGSLSIDGRVSWSSGDNFVVDKMIECSGYEVAHDRDVHYRFRYCPQLLSDIRMLGLSGVKSETKFIPDPYLYASIEDRKLLLAGLMDGDGTPARGHGSYTTISSRLKDDIIELCRGLGGVPMASEHDAWYKDTEGNKVECQRKWMICPRVPFNPFLLPRKAEKWKPHKRTLWRSIVGVRSLGYEDEMTCIKVSNEDGLYVVNDYVVTHNTDGQLQGERAQRLSASAIYKMSKLSVMSRFPDVGKCILLSFPRYRDDFIQQRYNESEMEPKVLRIKAKTWDMNPLITREQLEPEYVRNPVDAAARFECEPPEMIDAFFRDPERVRSCFRGQWKIRNEGKTDERKILTEVEEINPVNNDGTFKPWFKPSQGDDYTRFIHCDLALKRDRAALAMCHVPGTRNIEVGFGQHEQLPVVKMDLIHYWEAQPGQEIDFSGIREFIALLCKKFPVGLVTFDQWNSIDMIQSLNRRGIYSEMMGVKINHYDNLATCFYDGRFNGYFNHILVEDELLKLQVLENRKVDHPSKGYKDGSDALAGATWNACQYADIDTEIEIDILGTSDDWEEYEMEDALEDDRDGRFGKERTGLTEIDFDVENI